MKTLKNKIATIAIALFLMASMVFAPMLNETKAAIAKAQQTVNDRVEWNPIGVNQPQEIGVGFGTALNANYTIGSLLPATGIMTLPDGTTKSLGPFYSQPVYGTGYGNTYFITSYTPTEVGLYMFNFTWLGDTWTLPTWGGVNFTVQAAPVTLTIPTTSYLNLSPSPVGLGQQLLVTGWITPRQTLPGAVYYDLSVTFTKPDSTTYVDSNITTFPDGTFYFTYVPDQLGNWTVQLVFPGNTYTSSSQVANGNTYATASQTAAQPFTVQSTWIPPYPGTPYPNAPLTYPIQPNNKEWGNINGPWLAASSGTGQLGVDSTGSRFNPYSLAPTTAHILYMIPPLTGFAGVVGGAYGVLSTYAKTSPSVTVIMDGRGYYINATSYAGVTYDYIYCINITTGQTIWVNGGLTSAQNVPGSYTLGLVSTPSATQAVLSSSADISTVPELVYISALQLIKYDAATGMVTLNITSPIANDYNINGVWTSSSTQALGGVISYLGNDGTYAYILQRYPTSDILWGYYDIIKLDITGTGTDLPTRIIWNVTSPFNNQDYGSTVNGGICTLVHFGVYGNSGGINTTTGATLWAEPLWYLAAKPQTVGSGNGLLQIYMPLDISAAGLPMTWECISMATGAVLYYTQEANYPFGDFWAYGQADAYGMMYGLSYAGVYAYNATNGDIVWHYENYSPYAESNYGSIYPYGSSSPIMADGLVFAPESEHSPTFYYKGWNMDVLNAYNGSLVWQIGGEFSANSIADGVLEATNAEDGYAYAFGMGTSATTVSPSAQVVTGGNSILLKGTVLDTSAAQNGTACVADNCMTAWMEYLHQQQPCPANATGVQVSLDAVDPNNNVVHLGTVTSDLTGAYSLLWQPPLTGKYVITASFAGTESYYPSSAETTVGVPAAPTAAPTVTSPPAANYTVTFMSIAIAIIIAMIVAIAVATLLIIRKRP